MLRIGIDLRGTKIAAGPVDENGALGLATQEPADLLKPAKELAEAIYRLTERPSKEQGLAFRNVESVGIGVPGTADEEADHVGYANNFGFENVPLLKMLKDLSPHPAYGEDDTKAVAWGEYLAGAGWYSRSMTVVTLGTGVSGGTILNGRILEGDNGATGELGHMVIRQNGRPCTCGRKGCLKAYASATVLVNRAREAMERSDESMSWSLYKGDLSGIDGRMTFEVSEKGDSVTCEVLNGFMEDSFEGIANIINILQPEILCIDGGLSGAGEAPLAPVKEKAAPKIYSRISQKNIRIRLAETGNGAGIIGAACLDEQR